jgi:hypothetical protein
MLNNFRLRKIGKKGTIGTTIVWIIATILIAFLCVLVTSLVYYLTKAKPEISSSQANSRVFPEKAEMLYSILSSEIRGERVDNLIIRDDLKDSEKKDLLKKIPAENKGVWSLSITGEDTTSPAELAEKLNRKVIFPLVSDKKINVILNLRS